MPAAVMTGSAAGPVVDSGVVALTLEGGDVPGAVGYLSNTFRWMKIGPYVHLLGRLQLAGVHSGSGVALLSGLPFAAGNAGFIYSGVVTSSLAYQAGYTGAHVYTTPSSSLLTIGEHGPDRDTVLTWLSQFSVNSRLELNLTYMTDA